MIDKVHKAKTLLIETYELINELREQKEKSQNELVKINQQYCELLDAEKRLLKIIKVHEKK